jgi:DNA-binding PadR family transcriptional regulator
VLAEADYLDRSYPSVAQLEVSLGRLEASGLMKVVRPGWFRVTREGRAVLRQGRRLAAKPGSSLREAIVEALREVQCVKGRVRIGREAYDVAMRRHLGR